jgi:glycosyltransferase involved in cell wall biosynthesis
MKTLAIIITAYNSSKFILETLKSLNNQTLPKGWQTKFYIGVDNCKDTSTILDQNKISYFLSSENVGTYILTNSLLEKAKTDNCDIFLRFDSDDLANENFLYYGIKHSLNYNIVRNYFKKFYDDSTFREKQKLRKSYGSVFFTKKLLEDIGGYHHYRVSCDKFFYLRAVSIGYDKEPEINFPIYWYRIHNGSLTQKKETGMNSKFRSKVEKKMKKSIENGEIKINPVTVDLDYIQF